MNQRKNMTILRASVDASPYYQAKTHRKILRNTEISAASKAILMYLLGCSPSFNISVRGTATKFKECPNSISTYLQELSDHGYLIITPDRDRGKYASNYIIVEAPQNLDTSEEKPYPKEKTATPKTPAAAAKKAKIKPAQPKATEPPNPTKSSPKPEPDKLPDHIETYIMGVVNQPTTINKTALYNSLTSKYNSGQLDVPKQYKLSKKDRAIKQTENKKRLDKREEILAKLHFEKLDKALAERQANKPKTDLSSFKQAGKLSMEQVLTQLAAKHKKRVKALI